MHAESWLHWECNGMELNLEGKVIAITGGGTGIGAEAAMAFAREGAVVYILGRREAALKNCSERCRKQSLNVRCLVTDVTQKESIQRAVNTILRESGTIDVWINNAGVLLQKPLLETSREEYLEFMDANAYSVLLCTQVVAPEMITRGGGVFLNASSYAVKVPNYRSGVYAMAKCAVSSMTRVLSYELAPHNIRVVGYMPGAIATEMVAGLSEKEDMQLQYNVMGRRGTPQEVGALLCFLASDVSAYINGVDVEISGGKYAVQLPE